jgi:hypothetical protein
MRVLRLAGAAVVFVAAIVLSVRTSCTIASAAPPIPCTSTALGRAFDAHYHLSSIQNFGCEGNWAFVWATVGTGEYAFGVTEVMEFHATSSQWSLVSRATDCKATILPSVIYHQGCFSN